MSLLNLAILAHVDAGKTSLTERLLYDAGVIDHAGSVDAGTTRTDTLDLERRRGITIKAAVVAFGVGEHTVTLIDTPGHPDFIAEVERVLGVLDGAVLVVSAVEGVQAQTRILFRTLTRLRIPTLIFVNKIDRRGARTGSLLDELHRRLGPDIVALNTVRGAGTRTAEVVAGPDPALGELLAERDDRLLAALVDDRPVGAARLHRALAAQTRRAQLHPVLFGSAITGAGVPELRAALTDLLPAAGGDPAGPLSGTVFKVERGPAGEKLAYARLFSGTLRVRDRPGPDPADKVTAVEVFTAGATARRPAVTAGRIARLRGLHAVRVGDPLGAAPPGPGRQFAPPSLGTVVIPADPRRRGALYAALSRLAEQDPLIGLRPDLSLTLYGEVQKEVIAATLADEHGLRVRFTPTTTLCTERLTGTGEAVARIGEDTNPDLATVGLRAAPGPPGGGITFTLGVELGSMPPAFFTAVEESVRDTLTRGPHGWPVPDCAVTMTHSGYLARQSHAHGTFDKSMSSTAGDFRRLTRRVLGVALARAGTRVCEPIHRFTLELPTDTLGAVLPVLGALRGVPLHTAPDGPVCLVEGELPAARVHELRQRLPALTRGEGVLDAAFDHYAPAPERR
ncbi:TetM/TetW/TetO/TetS family tetracycline resistance ribosomal protection protein [Amorphoplanes nipponensis]|uniref:Tetracycline resistance protein, tetM/tetO subfamily n=1 Tax=Actinoplanes nipponensis TaxID=135950 RepID=A0A919JFP7_9ACTN|nr:TetM/TetW/TetO/TetS family tetracycline resistance ribosomal protection protein [Actinoplanes nipponensis]GIE48692.1 tetracycline resistance protein, tetM/tetO subfamily [Actinoplanes nipponensis]